MVDKPLTTGNGWALRQAFNEALAAIRADGTCQAINDRYFDFSIY